MIEEKAKFLQEEIESLTEEFSQKERDLKSTHAIEFQELRQSHGTAISTKEEEIASLQSQFKSDCLNAAQTSDDLRTQITSTEKQLSEVIEELEAERVKTGEIQREGERTRAELEQELKNHKKLAEESKKQQEQKTARIQEELTKLQNQTEMERSKLEEELLTQSVSFSNEKSRLEGALEDKVNLLTKALDHAEKTLINAQDEIERLKRSKADTAEAKAKEKESYEKSLKTYKQLLNSKEQSVKVLKKRAEEEKEDSLRKEHGLRVTMCSYLVDGIVRDLEMNDVKTQLETSLLMRQKP